MTDGELLRLAAKAIGRKVIGIAQSGFVDARPIGLYLDDGKDSWNPLADTKDAFELAVDLKIRIELTEKTTYARQMGKRYERRQVHHGDAYAATRRAIVYVAAELGKSMP